MIAKVSVAMCTYNGERYLPEQLQSIAQQTRLPDEMVVCDDASTDSTVKLVEDFACNVPFPVRLIQNSEILGPTRNFEQAMRLCSGDLIAFSDQDDVWVTQKLSRQAGIMEGDPDLGGAFSDATLIDDRSQPLRGTLWWMVAFSPRRQSRFRDGYAGSLLLRNNVVTGATLIVRSKLRPLFLNIPRPWYHDGWIAWMLVLRSRLQPIEEPLICYRLHANQHSGMGSAALRPLRMWDLRRRLESYKREELMKMAWRIPELKELERWMVTANDPRDRRLLEDLQRNLRFLQDRGSPNSSRSGNVFSVLRNTFNYQRYGEGFGSLCRDLVAALIR